MSVRIISDIDISRNEFLLEEMLGRIAEAVFVIDKQGRFLYANRSAYKDRGYTKEEFLKLNVKDINLPERADFVKERISEVQRKGKAIFETIHVRKDGSTFPVEVSSNLIDFAGVDGMIAVARDISERKGVAAKRHGELLVMQGILNSSDAPIFSVDAKGRYTSFNEAHADAMKLSYGVDIEIGKEIFGYLTVKLDGKNARANFKRVFQGERFTEETRYGDDKKSRLYFELTYNPILDGKGKVVGASVYARNITERRRAEIALKESEERYRNIFENTIVGVLQTHVDGTINFVNQAFARMLGYESPEDFKSAVSNLKDIYKHPEARSGLIRELKETSAVNDFRCELIRKDGSTVWFSFSISTPRDDKGNISVLNGLAVDITKSMIAEAQLQETVEKLAATLRAIPDLMFEVDTKGHIYDYHAPANDLLYAPPETFVGRNVKDVLPEPAAGICLKAIAKAASHGWSRGDVYLLKLPKAGKRWFELSIDTKNRGGKKTERLLVIARDITDRVLAEESIKRERDTAQMYLDIVNTVVVAVNAEGIVIMINKYGADLLGYNEKEIVGKSWFGTFVPYHERVLVEGMFKRMAGGEEKGVESYEHTVMCKNGEERLISWQNRFVNDGKGKFKFAVSSGVDITDVHEARYEVRQSYSQLQTIVDGIVKALSMTVETRDPYTAGHQRRVAQLAVAMASHMGWTKIQIKGLEMAATIHDIGKMYVPAEILNKPGKLDQVEFELIKLHSAAGYNIVKDIEFAEPVADMVRQHHERLDGSGYPDGLKHGDIVPGAKVMAVADVVEAMSSDRPYRPGRGLKAALEEVQDRKGGLYDADAVEACVELFVKAKFKFD